MGAHTAIARVGGVPMVVPIGGREVDLDIAGDAAAAGADAKRGAEEVRAGLEVPDAGVLDLHHFALRRLEERGAEARIEPDALKLPFRAGNGAGGEAVLADPAGRSGAPGVELRARKEIPRK